MLPSESVVLTRHVAEQAVPRACQFLRTVGTDSAIRGALMKVGFKDADLREGYQLLFRAIGAPSLESVGTSSPIGAALEKLQSWQAAAFPVARAALQRLHPEQATFLFDKVVAGTGPAAVIAAQLFLDRCTELESGHDRKHTRKADHAALATLEDRGITKSIRGEMAKLIDLVESGEAPPPDQGNQDRMRPLADLHAWVQDWSECARVAIKRRDQLIRLGIGKRKSRTPKAPPVAVAPAATATPAPAPVANVASIDTNHVAGVLPASAMTGTGH
jgi:hypothetical protein